MNAYGKHTAILTAPETAAALQLGAAGQETLRVFCVPSIIYASLDMSGIMKCVIAAPNTATDLRLGLDGDNLLRYFADAPEVMTALNLAGQGSRTMYAEFPTVDFDLHLSGESLRRFIAIAPAALINLGAKGAASMFGYSTIALPGLVLPVGGDLVIDTEEMTVTLNGVDVTRYFGADSEFFKLKPGENIVIYEDGVQNRNISYKILWKDLWL
jgi:hypothetical protein